MPMHINAWIGIHGITAKASVNVQKIPVVEMAVVNTIALMLVLLYVVCRTVLTRTTLESVRVRGYRVVSVAMNITNFQYRNK